MLGGRPRARRDEGQRSVDGGALRPDAVQHIACTRGLAPAQDPAVGRGLPADDGDAGVGGQELSGLGEGALLCGGEGRRGGEGAGRGREGAGRQVPAGVRGLAGGMGDAQLPGDRRGDREDRGITDERGSGGCGVGGDRVLRNGAERRSSEGGAGRDPGDVGRDEQVGGHEHRRSLDDVQADVPVVDGGGLAGAPTGAPGGAEGRLRGQAVHRVRHVGGKHGERRRDGA